VVESLPSTHKTLSSIPGTARKQNKTNQYLSFLPTSKIGAEDKKFYGQIRSRNILCYTLYWGTEGTYHAYWYMEGFQYMEGSGSSKVSRAMWVHSFQHVPINT
jgi:hypothetical protein